MCLSEIKKKIRAILKNRADSEHIAHNLSVIIHEDINRLELCFYLEGYKDGHKNVKYTNLLEKEIVKNYGLDYVYKNKSFNYFSNDEITAEIRENCYRYIDENVGKQNYIRNLTDEFVNKIVKNKIENLEQYVDKQLKMEFELYNIKIREIDYKLTEDEVQKINSFMLDNFMIHLSKVYKDAFWTAVNDKLSRRYR